jgi:hypothetical protein
MSARTRSALSLALTVGLFAVARPAAGQDAVAPASSATTLAPASLELPVASSSVDAKVAPSVAPAASGPTMESASVAVRHLDDHALAAAPRRGGNAPGVPLMVVGGAAIIGGLLVGGNAGGAIAVGGLLVGLYGLYEYLQ